MTEPSDKQRKKQLHYARASSRKKQPRFRFTSAQLTAFLIGIGFLFSSPAIAQADQPIPMVRTLCISEPGLQYFSAHIEYFPTLANYFREGRNAEQVTSSDARRDLLAKRYGILYPLSPVTYSYTCSLSSGTYTISGQRAPRREKGLCGGNPRIKLTLTKDEAVIIDKAFFEKSCIASQPVHILDLSVFETTPKASDIVVTLSDGKAQKSLNLGALQAPLLQTKLDCIAENKYLSPSTSTEQIAACSSQKRGE